MTPPCPVFGHCGGCSYQHLAYERQLAIKAGQVEQTLRRVGKLADVPMRPIVAAPKPYGYRNRIRVHSAGGVTGFFAHDARVIVDIEQCLLAVDGDRRELLGEIDELCHVVIADRYELIPRGRDLWVTRRTAGKP